MKTYYHCTDMITAKVLEEGLISHPLGDEVASIVGFDSGVYLADSVNAAKDLGRLKYGEGQFSILKVELPLGAKMVIDPEIGEYDSPCFITPDSIPTENISIYMER